MQCVQQRPPNGGRRSAVMGGGAQQSPVRLRPAAGCPPQRNACPRRSRRFRLCRFVWVFGSPQINPRLAWCLSFPGAVVDRRTTLGRARPAAFVDQRKLGGRGARKKASCGLARGARLGFGRKRPARSTAGQAASGPRAVDGKASPRHRGLRAT
jgi:hypothetical protein